MRKPSLFGEVDYRNNNTAKSSDLLCTDLHKTIIVAQKRTCGVFFVFVFARFDLRFPKSLSFIVLSTLDALGMLDLISGVISPVNLWDRAKSSQTLGSMGTRMDFELKLASWSLDYSGI